MVFKKKKKQEDILLDIEEEDDDEIIEDEQVIDENDDIDETDYNDATDMPATPMGLAHQISKESETLKHFKELPREVKYSFLDSDEKHEVKHFSKTYRNWKYIEKVIDLRVKEDIQLKQTKKDLILIKDRKDLVDYLKLTGRDYLIRDIDDMKQVEIDKLLVYIATLKHNYFLDTIENKKDRMIELYDDYSLTNDIPKYIDDMGNIGKIMDTSVASMGFKGNASTHSVLTINAVKNEDIQKTAEEKSSFNLLDTIKKKFG